MVQGLTDYVKKMSESGYDVVSIRTTLTNAGYPQSEIEQAILEAGLKKSAINTKLLVALFAATILFMISIIGVLKLTQEAPAELSAQQTIFNTEVLQGKEITMNTDIQNPSKTQTKGTIDFSIIGPQGKVTGKTESFTITERTSVPVSIKLPEKSQPGEYTAQVTISYGQKTLKITEKFTVLEESAVEEQSLSQDALIEKGETQSQTEEKIGCKGGCDDLNFCTVDNCVSAECVYTPVLPCCGNRECEPLENEDACQLDCAQKYKSPDTIKEEAKTLAQTNLNSAVNTCNTLGQQAYIDLCLADIAEISKNKETCEKIASDEMRDACYMPFAYQNDFSVCAKISNEAMKNSCTGLEQLSQIQQKP